MNMHEQQQEKPPGSFDRIHHPRHSHDNKKRPDGLVVVGETVAVNGKTFQHYDVIEEDSFLLIIHLILMEPNWCSWNALSF